MLVIKGRKGGVGEVFSFLHENKFVKTNFSLLVKVETIESQACLQKSLK